MDQYQREFAQLSNVSVSLQSLQSPELKTVSECDFADLVAELLDDNQMDVDCDKADSFQQQQQQEQNQLQAGYQNVGMGVQDVNAEELHLEPGILSAQDCPAVNDLQASVRVTEPPQQLSEADFSKPWHSQQHSPASSETSSPVRDLSAKVDYMKQCLGRYEEQVKENGSNGRIQVHQVVIFMLLCTQQHSEMKCKLDNILVFCDASGKPSGGRTSHFLAKDTKSMGLIWQQVKENKRATFDTFARAMRVGREKSKQYFEYLESGKGSKKRVYKLGPKCLEDMKRMESILPRIC